MKFKKIINKTHTQSYYSESRLWTNIDKSLKWPKVHVCHFDKCMWKLSQWGRAQLFHSFNCTLFKIASILKISALVKCVWYRLMQNFKQISMQLSDLRFNHHHKETNFKTRFRSIEMAQLTKHCCRWRCCRWVRIIVKFTSEKYIDFIVQESLLRNL